MHKTKAHIKYHEAITYLESFTNLPLEGDYMIDRNNLEVYIKRMKYFLKLLGNPHKNLKYIHIAGTAGKGTVTSMVHEILHSAGKNVGSFSSPSVTTSLEKIKVGGQYIAPDELADIVESLKPYIDEAYMHGPYGRPSYFEIFLAIAFIYFKNKKCDWVVLEVGLGGRYDATNVIEKPVVTAITNIDYDHTELLGKTLTRIAYEKAGIIKNDSVLFTTEQRQHILKIFKNICKSKYTTFNKLTSRDNTGGQNELLATAIAKYIGIDDNSIATGIHNAKLPCRFEIIQEKPIVILDGAHNRSKVKSTTDHLKRINYKKLYLVIGIAKNKDSLSMLKQIIPQADVVYFTRFLTKDRACAHPKELLAISRAFLKKEAETRVFLDPHKALSTALKNASREDAVLVTGSFFLAGELRKRWFPEEKILRTRKSF